MANLAARLLLEIICRSKRGGIIIGEHTLPKSDTEFHVQVLGRYFDFIGLDELPRRLAQPSRKPFCLFTFDDGKRSNFNQAAPVLERLGVPAVFYVTTDFLTTGATQWFDRRKQLIKTLGHCPAGLELERLKKLPLDIIQERIDRACAEYDFKPAGESDDVRPMSWAEARNLSRRGFAIGAHGVTHAILTRETRKRAFTEIEESLGKVTAEIGSRCKTFAFPNGNYDAELIEHALQCGASTLMTTDPMWADDPNALWRLPRIQLFEGCSRSHIELKIALAAIRGVLRNPNGTGRQYRYLKKEGRGLTIAEPLPNKA